LPLSVLVETMSEDNSYRQILRSTSIIGGSSVINIVIGLLRMKAVAMLLGPAGVGLIGLLSNVITLASNVAGLGFGNAGTRQIAEAAGENDPQRIATARRALFWGTLVLAVLGALLLWLLRDVLATHVLGDATLAHRIGWLSLGVALTVAAASQNALLNGLRRIGDIARMRIASALLSTVLGLLALWWWREEGIVVFVMTAPLATFLFGHLYVARLPKVWVPTSNLRELSLQWCTLVSLGGAFMVAGLAGTAGQLLVRTLVQHKLGMQALGQFEAAWMISMTYIAFVLGAMGTDFYPRLTSIIRDHEAVNRLVNEQTEVALLLTAPVILAMLALTPWVIHLLYTAEFAEAAMVLRWQVLGDFLKIASWPLGFILLADGAGRTYMITEWIGIGSFVLFTWVGLPFFGITATGIAFLGLYAVYLPLVYCLAMRRTQFSWQKQIQWQLIIVLGLAAITAGIAKYSEVAAALTGMTFAVATSLYGLIKLGDMVNPEGQLGRLVSLSRKVFKRIGFKR